MPELKNKNEIKYYLNIAISQKIDVRSLRDKIKNKEYERLAESTKLKLINEDKLDIKDLVPNPILIKNNHNIKKINIYEKILISRTCCYCNRICFSSVQSCARA